MDQLVASWEESGHKGGCLREKRVRFSARFSLFSLVFARTIFDNLGVAGKLAIPSLLKFRTCENLSLGPGGTVPRTGAVGVFFLVGRLFFRSRFRLNRGKSWRSESCTLCLNVSSFLNFQACGSNRNDSERICAQRQPLQGKTVKFSA